MKKGAIGVISLLAGAASGALGVKHVEKKKLMTERGYANKHLALYKMMAQWVKVKQQGKNLSSFFAENGYKKIAIYGMSYAGETLLEELKDSDIQIAYGIDKNASSIDTEMQVVTLDDDLEDVDAVIVTAITFFDEIEEELSRKINCPVISLKEVLYEV